MGSASPASVREPQPIADAQSSPAPAAPGATIGQSSGTGKGTSSTRAVTSAEDGALAPEGPLQSAVLQALTDGNQRILVSMLSAGEWSVVGNELVIQVAESQTVVDMSLGPDAKRLAIASASGVLGRAVKLKVIPGATVAPQDKKNGAPRPAGGPGGRGRAEQDPVVRRMQEKFNAEIRTVIDYRDKR